MLASGFTFTPVTRLLFFGTITSSLLVSIGDLKPYFHTPLLQVVWRYGQPWRLLIWQGCYTNSTELLFAMMLLYHLRVIERLWGSRKFASFILSTYLPLSLLPPLLTSVVSPLLLHTLPPLLPAGPTPLLFALLVQYHAAIPTIYKYKILLSSPPPSSTRTTAATTSTSSSNGAAAAPSTSKPSTSPSTQPSQSTSLPPSYSATELILSDKSPTYLLALQLALSSLPWSPLLAFTGYLIGLAWREGWGPRRWSAWRVPRWVVGEEDYNPTNSASASTSPSGRGRVGSGIWGGGAGEGFEGLRRRMEGDASLQGPGGDNNAGSGSGGGGANTGGAEGGGERGRDGGAGDGAAQETQTRRRRWGGVLDSFRGAF